MVTLALFKMHHAEGQMEYELIQRETYDNAATNVSL